MKSYYRATITIPTNIYQKVKMRAALQNKNVSKFITDLLRGTTGDGYVKDEPLPFGKYSLKGIKKIDREAIYEPYLRSKISR